MYSHRQRGVDTAAFEYDAQYEPQATVDRFSEDTLEKKQPGQHKQPHYKPTALRWYFVVAQILLLLLGMGLVIWARMDLPNADNAAEIGKRSMPAVDVLESLPLLPRQAGASSEPATEKAPEGATNNKPSAKVANAASEQPPASKPPAAPTANVKQSAPVNTVPKQSAKATLQQKPASHQPQETTQGAPEHALKQQPKSTANNDQKDTIEGGGSTAAPKQTSQHEDPQPTKPKAGTTAKVSSSPPETTHDGASDSSPAKTTKPVSTAPATTGKSKPAATSSEVKKTGTNTNTKARATKTTQDPSKTTDSRSQKQKTQSHTTEKTGGVATGTGTGTTTATGGTSTGTATDTSTDTATDGHRHEGLIRHTTTIVKETTKTITVPGTTGEYTTSVPVSIWTTVMGYTTAPEAEFSEQTTVVLPTTMTSHVVVTASQKVVDTTKTLTETHVAPVSEAASDVVSGQPASTTWTTTRTVPIHTTIPGQVSTKTIVSQGSVTLTKGVGAGPGVVYSGAHSSVLSTSYSKVVGTTTKPASTYLQLGRQTITKVYTEYPNKGGDDAKQAKPTAKVVGVVGVTPDKTVQKVVNLDPVTMVKELDHVQKIVASGSQKTFVSEMAPYTTWYDVVTTGADGLPTTTQTSATISGGRTTMVTWIPATTYMSTSTGETTITSDPGSTTLTSTMEGTTTTYSSTTTISPTSTPDANIVKIKKVYSIGQGGYFVGKFLPLILAVALTIPIRIIDLNAQMYQPFHALNRGDGALGPNSMTLHFSDWTGLLKPFVLLRQGQPVTFITLLLVAGAAVMTPLASQAIGVKLYGSCQQDAGQNCAAALGVSAWGTALLLALISLMIVLLLVLLFFMRRFDTGLYGNPWSVAGIAALATNSEIRPQRASERKIVKEMAEKRYGFGFFENDHGETEYGIVLYDDAGAALRERGRPTSIASSLDSAEQPGATTKKVNPFMVLTIWWRLIFMGLLLGLMILILYYHINVSKKSNFQSFMNSQTLGVRFLFSALGVLITFGWTSMFLTISMIVPFLGMWQRPLKASNSVLLSRSTNGFTGIYSAIKHGQPYCAVVAAMAILSDFMPMLLANVPYAQTQTHLTHNICARMSIVLLFIMVMVIAVSFFIQWPSMPVDPRSIAGAMYYVSESNMLDHFSGMGTMANQDRKRRIREMGGLYWYGEITTQSGAVRPAVEWDDGHLNAELRPPQLQHQQFQDHRESQEHQLPPQSPPQSPPRPQRTPTGPPRLDTEVDTAYWGYQP